MIKGYKFSRGSITPVDMEPYFKDRDYAIRYVIKAQEQHSVVDMSVQEVHDFLAAQDDIVWLMGEDFIALVTMGREWYSKEDILQEEMLSPRYLSEKADLAEFLAGMEALARLAGCKAFQFGTRANYRQAAFARRCEQLGCTVDTITLKRRI